MADPTKYKKSSTGQLIGQAIKELGLSVADHAMRGNDRGALANASEDVVRRSNDVERGAYGDEYRSRGQNAGDEDSDPSDSDDRPKKVRTVWK